MAPAESSASGVTATASFTTAGTYSWIVPAGVTSIVVTAQGGAGGADGLQIGGLGGAVAATVTGTAGAALAEPTACGTAGWAVRSRRR